MRIRMYVDSLASNSLGRAYCLWELAVAAGYRVDLATADGGEVWTPLRDTAFADVCAARVHPGTTPPPDTDLLYAVKPLPGSLDPALDEHRTSGIPLLVDTDDPDIELKLSWESPRLRVGREVTGRSRAVRRRRAAVRDFPTTVSNPLLQQWYGGTVVPHVRGPLVPGRYSETTTPTVAFVGTSHPHKGLALLREAVSRLSDRGYRLVVTDAPPSDAHPWESWVGRTALADGLDLVRAADVVVIPSLDRVSARGQLPVKLIDALLLGRAALVSDVAPLRWASGPGARVFPAGDRAALVDRLSELSAPDLRRDLGQQGRTFALSRYTVAANLGAFTTACQQAVAGSSSWISPGRADRRPRRDRAGATSTAAPTR